MDILWDIQTHECVDSTQHIIKEMAEGGAPEGLVVHAYGQTEGHGRHGRQWISLPGNLFISILLRPLCDVQNIGHLSILTGLALAQTVRGYLRAPDDLVLKWPNDALLGGRKCSGLLLETGLDGQGRVEWVAIGLGVNLKNAPDEGACLKNYTEKPLDIDTFRDELLENMARCYGAWRECGFEVLREEWLALAHKRGTTVSVKIGSQIEYGRFYDIDERGSLLLEKEDGRIQTVTAGDVYISDHG